ncbi:MAG: CBS domain-containing protein [Polyangiales bacterium]
MLAKDIMTEDPITVTERTPVAEALGVLYELDVRHLPVIRAGELVGIVSDRDLRRFDATSDDQELDAAQEAATATVGSFMNTAPVRADPETSARELIEAMLLHRVGAIPVTDVDTGALLGIVSYVDLLRMLQEMLEPS